MPGSYPVLLLAQCRVLGVCPWATPDTLNPAIRTAFVSRAQRMSDPRGRMLPAKGETPQLPAAAWERRIDGSVVTKCRRVGTDPMPVFALGSPVLCPRRVSSYPRATRIAAWTARPPRGRGRHGSMSSTRKGHLSSCSSSAPKVSRITPRAGPTLRRTSPAVGSTRGSLETSCSASFSLPSGGIGVAVDSIQRRVRSSCARRTP